MRRIGIQVATALAIAGSIGAAASPAQEVADEVLFAAARDLTGPRQPNRARPEGSQARPVPGERRLRRTEGGGAYASARRATGRSGGDPWQHDSV